MGESLRQRARRVLLDVADLHGAVRTAAIDRACDGDSRLRAEVEALLEAESRADASVSGPGGGGADQGATGAVGTGSGAATIIASSHEQIGQMIGRYKLLELLGEGGFGTVWAAEQREPVKRRVALKVVKLGMDTRQVIARFEAERQALAMMDHPNIAKVLDAGATGTGRPYFVMELVKGVPIIEYCDRERLETRARLDLFTSVCQAIQHAHQKGIIHRDIKPSNVLITLHDGVPVPKVIDFGIAKATNAELTEKTIYTQHRQMIGTPAYMSPEQAEMSGLDIDTRSDIYSLGVLLYELLTGTTPFANEELLSKGFAEMMRLIREVEPHKPSTRLSSLGQTATRTAEHQRLDIRRLGATLRGDLDWIVMKCLEKDRQRRYETANALAADIQRHLRHEPVLAGPPSAGYRLAKFVRRNRGGVGAAAFVGLALLLGVVGTSVGMYTAVGQRRLAEESARRASQEADRASRAEIEAERRAAELELVSDYQSEMIARIDLAAAGTLLSEDVGRRYAAALGRQGLAGGELEAGVRSFTTEWERVNAVDVAAGFIDREILRPALETIDAQLGDQPLVDAQLRLVLADCYRGLGMLDAAAPLGERAVEIRRRELGEDDPGTIGAMIDLAEILTGLSRNAEAEAYLREAMGRASATLGEDSELRLSALSDLAATLAYQGKYAEAEVLQREALELSRRLYGELHPTTMSNLNGWGVVLGMQRKLEESREVTRDYMEKCLAVYGEDDRRTLMALANYASCLPGAEAEPYWRRVLAARGRLLGEDHYETVWALYCVGLSLGGQGRLDEAESILREALMKMRRARGDDHENVISIQIALARVLGSRGQAAEAETLLRAALEWCMSVQPVRHSTDQALRVLGRMLLRQARYAEAEPLLRQLVQLEQERYGPDSLESCESRIGLVEVLAGTGRRAEAEPVVSELRRTVGRAVDAGGMESLEQVLSVLTTLAVRGEDSPAGGDAAALRAHLLELAGRRWGEDHEFFGRAEESLAAALAARGEELLGEEEHKRAEGVLRECVSIRERVLGAGHWLVHDAGSVLGAAIAGQGRFAEAEPILLESWERMVPPADMLEMKSRALRRVVELYEAWDLAEPGVGHAAAAAEWRARLEAPSGASGTRGG